MQVQRLCLCHICTAAAADCGSNMARRRWNSRADPLTITTPSTSTSVTIIVVIAAVYTSACFAFASATAADALTGRVFRCTCKRRPTARWLEGDCQG